MGQFLTPDSHGAILLGVQEAPVPSCWGGNETSAAAQRREHPLRTEGKRTLRRRRIIAAGDANVVRAAVVTTSSEGYDVVAEFQRAIPKSFLRLLLPVEWAFSRLASMPLAMPGLHHGP